MTSVSSPITYPPSSSPIGEPQCLKRKRIDSFQPAKRFAREIAPTESSVSKDQTFSVSANQISGPFEDDDSEEEIEPRNDDVSEAGDVQTPSSSPPSITVEISAFPVEKLTSLPSFAAKTSRGLAFRIGRKRQGNALSYESMIAARSEPTTGKASKNYYGIEIHDLLDSIEKSKAGSDVAAVIPTQLQEEPCKVVEKLSAKSKKRANMLWTEKYRARRFTDLVGDDRVHRDVLRWMKRWDSIVFPGMAKVLPSKPRSDDDEPKAHRKILLLTGPPGLGKTTLAHVCAKQAGYEVLEINASDDRTSAVVKGRVKDCLGTENVRNAGGDARGGKGASNSRPVCVVVDEVDGVVTGSGPSGEGGFIKALLDLVTLDQKNSNALQSVSGNAVKSRRKGDTFRQLRPLILICNDVYHPSLRPLRTSQLAEVIHIRRPPFDKVVSRLSSIFTKEGLPCDHDAVRKLCEGAWGPSNKKENNFQLGSAGDLRGCLVLGEWVAARLRASPTADTRLTRAWIDTYMADSMSHASSNSSAGRGGVKEVVERVFLHNAGFSNTISDHQPKPFIDPTMGIAEAAKKTASIRLRELADAVGDSDRILVDCFSTYASRPIQDDTFLTKPNAACEWLHFHDQVSSKTHQNHEWELGAYLSQSILGFHNLFATNTRQVVQAENRWDATEEPESQFSGARAHAAASEARKQNMNVIHSVQSSLSIPLARCFRSTESLATELVPQLMRMLTPDVKPVVVGSAGGSGGGVVSVRKDSERHMIARSVEVMGAVGVSLERMRIEAARSGQSNYIYRMEPPLDDLSTFETYVEGSRSSVPARFAVREAMKQEHEKFVLRKQAEARQARYHAAGNEGLGQELATTDATIASEVDSETKQKEPSLRRDFFGRPMSREATQCDIQKPTSSKASKEDKKIWLTYHEGFSNAVRKPITLEELLKDFEKPA